jgi:uncharacterized membrane protein YphA (DoxX/SURF4 family)
MNIALWVAQALLALMFLMAGSMKAFQYQKAKESLPWVKDAPKGLVTFIGVAEILGALGVVLPLLVGLPAILTPLAAAGLALVMLLAAGFHLKRGENKAIGMNLVLAALAAFVTYGRM